MSHVIYTCVLCDMPVKVQHRFCSKHYTLYGSCHEQWLIMLLDTQKKQRVIDRMECYTLDSFVLNTVNGEKPQQTVKKVVGRPSTHWLVVNQVLAIYDESVELFITGKISRIKSLRAIAKELDNKIGYCTVRNILKEYRTISNIK